MEKIDSAKNPFKQLESDQSAPSHIKEKVMASVNFSNMLVDITELFTGNMANSVTSLFKVKELNVEKKNKKDKED